VLYSVNIPVKHQRPLVDIVLLVVQLYNFYTWASGLPYGVLFIFIIYSLLSDILNLLNKYLSNNSPIMSCIFWYPPIVMRILLCSVHLFMFIINLLRLYILWMGFSLMCLHIWFVISEINNNFDIFVYYGIWMHCIFFINSCLIIFFINSWCFLMVPTILSHLWIAYIIFQKWYVLMILQFYIDLWIR